jgi:hypothetical protein
VTTTDGTLPRSDNAGGGLGGVDGQGFHVCDALVQGLHTPARVAAQPLIRKLFFVAQCRREAGLTDIFA